MKNSMALIILISLFSTGAISQESTQYMVENENNVKIEVKGVVCSFCAYGTEKNLARLKFVDQNYFEKDGVLLDLKKAAITLAIKNDEQINVENIKKAIVKGGYSPVNIYFKLNGTLTKEGDQFFIINKFNKQKFQLLNKKGENWQEDSYSGKNVSIQAFIPVSSIKENNTEAIAVHIIRII